MIARDRHVVQEHVAGRVATEGQARAVDVEPLAELRTFADDEEWSLGSLKVLAGLLEVALDGRKRLGDARDPCTAFGTQGLARLRHRDRMRDTRS